MGFWMGSRWVLDGYLDADGVLDAAHVLDVRAVQLAGALADPQKVRGAAIPGTSAHIVIHN
eukprot:876334-Prorocentrum_minimum.AAC.7